MGRNKQYMAEQTATIKTNSGYIPAFDGIRGLFSFTILIIHLHFSLLRIPNTLGYFTMHCFFIMSSFLITRGLINDKKRHLSFGSYYKFFYIKRSLRILPVYVSYLLLCIAIALFTYHSDLKKILGLVYEFKYFGWMLLTFTYNFKDFLCLYTGWNDFASPVTPHLWSLSLEEQFYFSIPFIIYFCSTKTLKRITIAAILIFPAIRVIGYYYLIHHPGIHLQAFPDTFVSFILYRCTFFQFDAFFYGIFVVLFDFQDKRLIKIAFYTVLTLLVVSIIYNGIVVSQEENKPFMEVVSHYSFMIKNGQFFYLDFLVNSLCVLLFYLSFKLDEGFSIFKTKFFVFIGKISYGVYVYQYIFIYPAIMLLTPFVVKHLGVLFGEALSMFLALSPLILLSNLSYQKMELYFINLKDKYLPKKNTAHTK